MRKVFAVMLCGVMLAVMSSCAWGDVAINVTNFPDDVFREYINSHGFDADLDGTLSDTEIANITQITVYGQRITSLQGIEYFTALTELDCFSNQLTTLDVSRNTSLTTLYCADNNLTTLDVSHNTALTWLWCPGNQLTMLDVSHNTALTTLGCYQQHRNGLIISNTSDTSYPYQLDFSNYMNSGQFLNVSEVRGRNSSGLNIVTTYANGIARFASSPASVTYSYNTGYTDSGGTMDVTISGEAPDTPDTPSTPATSSDLSTAWNSHKYTVFNSPMTWTEAKSYCESLGGHLATITSQEEYDAILNILPQDEKRLYWLGASDADNEGSWQWITGEDFSFTKWLAGEPNGGNSENYLILTNYYNDVWGWNDATNSHAGIDPSEWSFICEWEPVKADFAPMNPAYLRFLENPEAYLQDPDFYGDIPDPLDLSHLADNPPRNTTAASSMVRAASKHDPRGSGVLPDVRNQNPYGTCWSFASLGALETSYSKQYGTESETSELHQAWFVYKDPRPGYSYPFNRPQEAPLDQGGNSSKSIAFLSRAGTAAEYELPYTSADIAESLTSGRYPEDYSNPIRLKEACRLGPLTALNRNEIKNLIYRHGAVTISYEHKYAELSGSSYYYRTSKEHGHMVDAMGWDDNYPKENFKNKPSENGAWLIRNSWGTNWADGGYFWMSYEQAIGDCAVYIAAKDSGLKHRGYDVLTQAGRNDFRWSANVFRADGSESIREVAFTTADNNVPYEIYINKLGKSVPVNPGVPGTKAVSGTMPYAGYHTIALANPVDVADGEYFAVILKTDPSSTYRYSSAVEDTETVRTASVNVGESYFARTSSDPSAADWIDGVTIIDNGTGRPCNACVKAFTLSAGQVPATPTPDAPTPDTPTPDVPTPDTPAPDDPTPSPSPTAGNHESGGCNSGIFAGGLAVLAFTVLLFRKH
ncbi:MAG: leucine-rich repeat domain-containing protein [Synergistaceae bacterium]|nr:leucine-rich repeat domain-containing protein [Synergistaceae bacterium]